MSKAVILLAALCAVLISVHSTVIPSSAYTSYCASLLPKEQKPTSCLDLLCQGYTASGVYTVHPTGRDNYKFDVYCDQKTDGGGWTVFQRRMDGSVKFYRNWYNYKLGFGKVEGEHWLGNDKLHDLTSSHGNRSEIRVDMEAVNGDKAFSKYGVFGVADEADLYRLTVTSFDATSTGGDSLDNAHNQFFTTKDQDNDTWPQNCAVKFHGAWWYRACHKANLNGKYLNGTHTSFANGVNWRTWKGYHESLKTTEMKFRANL